MMLKIKEHIFNLREEGLFFYFALGFVCTAAMEGNDLLSYHLQQSIFFDTIMGFMPINIIMFLLGVEIVLSLFNTLMSNTKVNTCTIHVLNELHKRINQISFIASFSSAGIAVFCALTYVVCLIIGKESYYGKYAITFAIVSLFFILIRIFLSWLTRKVLIPIAKDIHGKIFASLVIVIIITIPYFYNPTETMTLVIDKDKYQKIKEKTHMKPEEYINKKINEFNFE